MSGMQEPPHTGNSTIDAALARVAAASATNPQERSQVLNDAQSVLQGVLRASREETPPPAGR